MIPALLLVPAIAGLLAFWLKDDRLRRLLLVTTVVVHAGLTVACWIVRVPPVLDGWFALDPIGNLFLSITSLLFLAAGFYGVGYLRRELPQATTGVSIRKDEEHESEAVFTGCLLLFLATTTMVTVSHHLGLLWVGVEATTLATAPLIYFHRNNRSLEATWKYLLICSVGIAMALLGNFFLAVSVPHPEEPAFALVLGDLLAHAGNLDVRWLKMAFVFVLVGYGTKMGLAPMHTWLPDAHSEAPSMISALLSGALLNCAFLGILRVFELCAATGLLVFARHLLVLFGLLSMAVSAVFILGQGDYKRLLAYSSIEHMGILSLGVGIGATGVMASMYHAINHSLTKAMLFFAAGNVMAVYRTKDMPRITGMARVIPVTGALWIVGLLAITGSPPFGAFFSEFMVLKAALDGHSYWIATAYLLLLTLVFIGMGSSILRMTQGAVPAELMGGQREPLLVIVPPIALGLLILALGLYLPPFLKKAFLDIARTLGG